MTVPMRHILTAGVASIVVLSAGYSVADPNSGHAVHIPGVNVGTTTHQTTSTCCDGGKSHNVNVPGVTVPSPNLVINSASSVVGTQVIIDGGSTLQSSLSGGGADTRTTFLSNRSYIPMADPIIPSTLNLGVAGSTQVVETVTEQVPVQEEICIERIVDQVAVVPVRASCIDDTGTPHPASRLDGDLSVAGNYNGEVFRCVAGTSMQVTVGALVNGQADFTQANGFSCAKGEALIHKSGGELSCAPEVPRRNCNERSLLRKHGPGIKMIEARVQKKVCDPSVQTRYQTVQKEVLKEVPIPASPITFDGGVGQIVTY